MQWSRIRALFLRRPLDERLDEEVQAHLEALAADYERRGLTPEQARYAARRDFGGVEPMKETYRNRRGVPWIDDLLQDMRFARRGLVRTPGFTCVAVLTLTVGVGANTAIFSLVDAVLLRPLPVRQPHELVLASHEVDGRSNIPVAAYEFRALRAHREVLADLAAFRPLPVGVGYRGETEMALGQLVSGNYHGLLGVPATLGRVLTNADDVVPRGHAVAVISEGYWQRRFGGSGTVIGESIHINGVPFTIVGVSARGFMGTEAGRAVDVTLPLSMQVGVFGPATLMNDASQARWLYLIGRLAPGVTRERAQVPLALEWDRLTASRVRPGRSPSKQTFRLLDGSQGRNDLRERFSLPLRILMAMVVLVLLIACGNLATLLIARSNARRQELGLRLALGASRGRLLRQLLTESLMLSMVGGVLGIAVAYLASGTLVQLMAGRDGDIVLDLAPNLRTALFTLTVSVISGVVFGSLPSLRAARFGIATAARVGTSAAAGSRWNQTLVVAQAAVCLLLLVEAGLFARSLSSLRGLDAGFAAGRSVLLANIRPSGTADGLTGVVNLVRDLSGTLSALQARSVTFSMDTPLSGVSMTRALEAVEGVPQLPDAEPVSFNFVGPHFFETMDIPLKGRDIRVEDDERAPAVAVVSRLVAARYFPGVNAVGKRIRTGGTDFEIVGVASDVKYGSLRGQAAPMVYLPYQQGGRDATRVGVLTVAVRAIDDAGQTAAALRREVRSLAPGAVIARLMTLDELTNSTLARERVVATLSVSFGAIAMLLGCIGLYGTLAYAVTRRTSEFGVRIALGASRSRLVASVLGDSLHPVAIGILLGTPLAFAAGSLSESLLFGVTGRDLPTYLLAVTMLAVSAVWASWLPARRAASVNPIMALRSE